jgi:amino acid transporter
MSATEAHETAGVTTAAPALERRITLAHGVALAVSMVIGSGLLGLPGIALEEGGLHGAAAGWLVAVVSVVPLIAIFSRLGFRFASAAGLSRYAEVAAGPWAGYGVSVVMAGSFIIGIPALGIIGGAYLQDFLGTPGWTVAWFGIAILGLVTLANILGVRVAGLINTASLAVLVGVVVLVVALKVAFLGEGFSVLGETARGDGHVHYLDVWTVSAVLFWAFLGWESLSFGLEEFQEPERSIPIVYWVSFVIVALLYLGLGYTTIGADARGVEVAGPSGLAALFRDTAVGGLLLALMILVILANANAWVFGASRSIYASGRDGILPRPLGRLSLRSVPAVSLVALFAIYTTVILVVRYGDLSLTRLILIVSQNLLVLYAFSIYAYWKTERGSLRWLVAALALVSWAFLLSGFSYWIAYPLVLLLVGWLQYRRRERRAREA